MTKQQAHQQAQRAANSRKETIIVFRDDDFGTWDFASESHWYFLLDTAQVEQNWLEAVVTPTK